MWCQLNRLHEQIQGLKARLTQNQKDSEQRNRDLKQEKEAMLVHFQHLKGDMSKSRAKERQNLTDLTMEV